MEEQTIKENFCKYCLNNKKGCYKLIVKVQKDIKTYKCENYKYNINLTKSAL